MSLDGRWGRRSVCVHAEGKGVAKRASWTRTIRGVIGEWRSALRTVLRIRHRRPQLIVRPSSATEGNQAKSCTLVWNPPAVDAAGQTLLAGRAGGHRRYELITAIRYRISSSISLGLFTVWATSSRTSSA